MICRAVSPAAPAPSSAAPACAARRSRLPGSPRTSSATRSALRRRRSAPDVERFSLSDLPPVHRGLLIGDVEAAGTPILLVHGLVDNRSIFTLLRRQLRRRGFGRVWTMNYRIWTTDLRAAARQLGDADRRDLRADRLRPHPRDRPLDGRPDRPLLRATPRRRCPGPHPGDAGDAARRHPRCSAVPARGLPAAGAGQRGRVRALGARRQELPDPVRVVLERHRRADGAEAVGPARPPRSDGPQRA